MSEWDHTVDLVAVGSGGGGLMAAIAGSDAGLSTLVVEKQPHVGGSTSMSGGVLWVPANPLMREEGVLDSVENGMAYFDSVVGDVGACSTPAKREAYIRRGGEVIEDLRAKGVEFIRAEGYADYYSSRKGGVDRGRSVECRPFDASQIPEYADKMLPGIASMIGMTVYTNELRSIQYVNRSPRAFLVAARVGARTAMGKLRRKRLLTNGSALIANLVKIARDQQVPIWLETPVQELVVEAGRVVGVVVVKEGRPFRVRATRGVLLAAGGFSRNGEMRKKFSEHTQPADETYSVSNPGDTGEVLEQAIALGAKTDLLDEAWWLPSAIPQLAQTTIGQGRQRPNTILVSDKGRRFVNEADSMVEVAQGMFAHSDGTAWLIHDDDYRKRYVNGKGRPGILPPNVVEEGFLKRADTIEELAVQMGIDPTVLAGTVSAWNKGAVRGLDPEFHRGESTYNRCMGDPSRKVPNPAVGPILAAPFYAAKIIPADVGTCGGVLTDEHARVLGEDDRPIPGLYATGNITATVMGRAYPGPGASIANTIVFGYAAAKHVAGAR
ncbi:FAD-binding protein [Nocardioides sp. dk4132]|uniref:FAD-binding protein n=1 Tax=unclassified Nocardioides TaxID=2615069 RepID=UPI001295E475|nr:MULTISPECIES: FAD-binding protein [unclassified Nocardioides]MQW77599.1 FAD-binding protein [Nocardioides sp. dk4132]QGA06125.1 FAD-binding protein [Nocardioides sp. dk884]